MSQFQKKFTPKLTEAQENNIVGAYTKSILLYNELISEHNEFRNTKWLKTPKDEWIVRRLLKDNKYRFAKDMPADVVLDAFRSAYNDLYQFNNYKSGFPCPRKDRKYGHIEILSGITSFKEEEGTTFISIDHIGDHILLTNMKTYTQPIVKIAISYREKGVFVFDITFLEQKLITKDLSLQQ